jgi:hypothetical protein
MQYGASTHLMAASSGFDEALAMLNQVMRSVSLQCVCMAIKMACSGGSRHCLFQLLYS